jgi:excisionase family DNA binding protein
MTGDRLLTLPEVGRYLGVSRSAAYALARSGSLPTIRIARRVVRVHPDDLRRFLEARRSGGEGS